MDNQVYFEKDYRTNNNNYECDNCGTIMTGFTDEIVTCPVCGNLLTGEKIDFSIYQCMCWATHSC